jgi:hypothetical protein
MDNPPKGNLNVSCVHSPQTYIGIHAAYYVQANATSDAHNQLARTLSERSTVLLKVRTAGR